MKEEVIIMENKIEKIEQEQKSFYMEILDDYKRSNKIKDVVIFVLIGIIALFVAGLMYILTHYDFSFDDNVASTGEGNACVGENCNNGELNGVR